MCAERAGVESTAAATSVFEFGLYLHLCRYTERTTGRLLRNGTQFDLFRHCEPNLFNYGQLANAFASTTFHSYDSIYVSKPVVIST